jgi:hypothetical protein
MRPTFHVALLLVVYGVAIIAVSKAPRITSGVREVLLLFCISSIGLLLIGRFVWWLAYGVGAGMQVLLPIYVGYRHVSLLGGGFAGIVITFLLAATEWLVPSEIGKWYVGRRTLKLERSQRT